MTDMEHAIEHAARDEANRRHAAAERSLNKSKYGEGSDYHANDGARAGFVDGAEWAVEHLRAQGLIAPAPLREEWAARYVNGGGAVCRTRDEAEAELDRMICDLHRPRIDEPPAPEIAGIYARYVSDWRPVDRAEGDGRAEP